MSGPYSPHAIATAFHQLYTQAALERDGDALAMLENLGELAERITRGAEHRCVFCEQPMLGGNSMTMLEHDGQRGRFFSHGECYWRYRATTPPLSDLLMVVAHSHEGWRRGGEEGDVDEAIAQAVLSYLTGGTRCTKSG